MDLTPRGRIFNFNTQEDYTNFIESCSIITQLIDGRYDCLSNMVYDMLFELVKKFHCSKTFEYTIIRLNNEEWLIMDKHFNKINCYFRFDIQNIKFVNDSNKDWIFFKFDEKLQELVINQKLSYYHD